MDVFFYEAFEEEETALRSFMPESVSAGFTYKTIQESRDSDPPAPIISIRTQSAIPPEWAGSISALLARSTGYDHLLTYRKKHNAELPCGYLPLYCNRAVAEQAMLLWMSLLRKLPRQIDNFTRFHRDGLTGSECEHKTLLVVGVGNIGLELVKIGKGLGMTVLGVDIDERHDTVEYISIEEGLKRADIIVCAMNVTDDNRDYFKYMLLKKTHPGTLFINIARGELSPTGDLLRLISEGHLGGVGLDVYTEESALAVSLRSSAGKHSDAVDAVMQLNAFPNVICTPHNAFNTREAVSRKAAQSIQQILHFLSHSRFKWPVPLQ